MLAVGDAERLGAVALVPWVALLGVESDVLGGACSGAAATGLTCSRPTPSAAERAPSRPASAGPRSSASGSPPGSRETADEFELAESGRVFRGFTGPVHERDGAFLGRISTLREVTRDRELDRLRDAFLASVSHELRTPLTSISGFLELLDDEEHALGEDGRRYLAVIRRSTARLQRLVEDLLLVAQLEAGRLELDIEALDLADLAVASAEAARPAADAKGVQVVVHGNGGARVQGDAQRLGQVLDNLLSNAIKFTASGGVVTVSTAGDDGWGRVVVADTGVGIPRDEQERLFSRLFRASSATSRAIPGTGLGLSIARALVEQHGGSIALESREGEGTRATVALPAQLGGA